MPRIARIVAVEFPHHIIQRGNNREKVFFAQATREKYLDLLKQYAPKWDVSIMAYCLMSNHIHLLVRPHQPEALGKMMQGVSMGHTKYMNQRYKRTGRLWESRYYSCVIDEEPYLWEVGRYIEQNPKRANIVRKEENYPYSSAPAHILGKKDELLTEALFPEESRTDYVSFLKARSSERETNQIRTATRTGRPLGDNKFIGKIEKILGRNFIKITLGRTRK